MSRLSLTGSKKSLRVFRDHILRFMARKKDARDDFMSYLGTLTSSSMTGETHHKFKE